MTGTAISTLRNLGPATEAALQRAGVPDAETLRSLGADVAYGRLLASGTRPHFISYYVLVMALQGRPWNDARGSEKVALRARFDALVRTERLSGDQLPPGLALALDFFGVRALR